MMLSDDLTRTRITGRSRAYHGTLTSARPPAFKFGARRVWQTRDRAAWSIYVRYVTHFELPLAPVSLIGWHLVWSMNGGYLSMANATVRLVVVGRKKEIHRSIVAFQDELLNNLGWFGSIDFFVHAANNDPANLQSAANKAVADAQAALTAPQAAPAAVVAGGVQATSCLQIAVQNSAGPTVPIIQAVGGAVPPNPQNYVTGFIINALATAEYHLDHVPSRSVTVLYDDTPGTPSLDVYNNLYAYNQAKPAPRTQSDNSPSSSYAARLENTRPYKVDDRFHADPECDVLQSLRRYCCLCGWAISRRNSCIGFLSRARV